MAKMILVKEFSTFGDRLSEDMMGFFTGDTKTDKIWYKLMTMCPSQVWRPIRYFKKFNIIFHEHFCIYLNYIYHRNTFSPIFTSGKLKMMIHLINEINNRLIKSLEAEAKRGKDFDVREHFGKFTMDTIASCGFGVDAQSFTNSNSPFLKNGRAVFRRTLWENITAVLLLVPGYVQLKKALKIPIFKVRLKF